MKIFQNLDKYWQRYKSNILYSGLDEKKKTGKIRPFDEEFYSSLDGMYYNGIPVYY